MSKVWQQEPMWVKRNEEGVVIEIRETQPKEIVYLHKGFDIYFLPGERGYRIADARFAGRKFNLIQDAIDVIDEEGDSDA